VYDSGRKHKFAPTVRPLVGQRCTLPMFSQHPVQSCSRDLNAEAQTKWQTTKVNLQRACADSKYTTDTASLFGNTL
jgi:hypothetical protein